VNTYPYAKMQMKNGISSSQYRMHFIGALALDGMKVFAQEFATVDADNMITFFKALESTSVFA